MHEKMRKRIDESKRMLNQSAVERHNRADLQATSYHEGYDKGVFDAYEQFIHDCGSVTAALEAEKKRKETVPPITYISQASMRWEKGKPPCDGRNYIIAVKEIGDVYRYFPIGGKFDEKQQKLVWSHYLGTRLVVTKDSLDKTVAYCYLPLEPLPENWGDE